MIKKNWSFLGQLVFEIFNVANSILDGVFWSYLTVFISIVAFPPTPLIYRDDLNVYSHSFEEAESENHTKNDIFLVVLAVNENFGYVPILITQRSAVKFFLWFLPNKSPIS